MNSIISTVKIIFAKFDLIGNFFPMLLIRLLLAWEFWEAGVEKFNGENWFSSIQSDFPFPFNIIPTDISWFLATWTELLGALALIVGFATRFTALSLIILDIVAWISVHAGNGYNVGNNGFKLPLIYLVLMLPLLFSGPGKASIDHFIKQKFNT